MSMKKGKTALREVTAAYCRAMYRIIREKRLPFFPKLHIVCWMLLEIAKIKMIELEW